MALGLPVVASCEDLELHGVFLDALKKGVYLGVRTCELFLCFVAIVRVRVIMLTSLFSLFYVTSWSRTPDQIQMYPDRDTIAQLLPARRLCFFVFSI